MFIHYITTALLIASSTMGAKVVFKKTTRSTSTTTQPQTSSRAILTDTQNQAIATAIPGSSPGIAIIGDSTYTAGGPAVTSGSNTLNSILTNGVVYNDQTYTYTTTSVAFTTLPSFGIGSTPKGNGTVVLDGSGETLYPGGPALTTKGHTISAATNGVAIDGKVADMTIGDISVPLQTVTFESETLTASEVSSGVFRVYTATLTAGGAAQTVLGQQVSAASSGLVVKATAKPSGSGGSSTSGAERLTMGCWAGLVLCGLLFSLL